MTQAAEPVLELRDLRVEFQLPTRNLIAVDGISCQLEPGKTLGIVGESGSGKSVTAMAIMGLLAGNTLPLRGEIWFRDRESERAINLVGLHQKELRHYRGDRLAMIFQEPMSALNPVMTIGNQLIETILAHRQISKADARQYAIARLQEVRLIPSTDEIVEDFTRDYPKESELKFLKYRDNRYQQILDRYPHQLSGGQLQRVTIAMAISCDPTLLIADEPTTALDVTVQAEILALLRELQVTRQMSTIFISHDLGVIAQIADIVAVMYRGKIVECLPARDLFINAEHPYTKALLACRPQLDFNPTYLPTIEDFLPDKIEEDDNKKGVTPDHNGFSSPSPSSLLDQRGDIFRVHPLIEVTNLAVHYPIANAFGTKNSVFKALQDIEFNVYRGETLGLVGESGSGKSTIAKALLGLTPIADGSIVFDGKNLSKLNPRQRRETRRDLQIVFQNPFSSLNPRLTIGEIVMEPWEVHSIGKNRAERRKWAGDLLEKVGLDAAALNRYPHEFSGGQRQRISIARALTLNPKCIICDESVSALDVSVQAQVLNLLKQLQRELYLTYIFISHDLSVVKFMSDRLIVLNRGKIEETGRPEDIYANPEKEYTKRLIAAIPKIDISPAAFFTST
jgi:peptide/nickel transport system ATP-binding protein